MSYLLGIDAGTTRTAAAVGRPDGRRNEVEIVDLGDRSSSVPSVLYVATDRTVVVGEAAERRALTDPDRVVREFKRRIGDSTPIIVGGVPWTAQDLSARLVRWVVDRVAAREGGPADRIVVTHPAAWGNHKKDLFGAALREQGLAVTFLAEPQAAALHYAAAERVEPGSRIAVYDLGGGTFDAAVVHKAAGAAASGAAAFELLGRPEGIERLGGIDFDEVVFDHVLAGMPDAFAELDDTDPAVLSAVSRVRRECTEAKEALSSDTDVSISVLLPSARGSVRLHRTEFEAMIRPQLEETVAALRRAVGSANLTPAELSAVLLVGGSSRIPLVAQLVSEQLDTPVAVDADPKNAIAKGAALALGPAQAVGAGATPPTGTPVAGIQRTGGPGVTGGAAAVAGGAALGAGAAAAGAAAAHAAGGGAGAAGTGAQAPQPRGAAQPPRPPVGGPPAGPGGPPPGSPPLAGPPPNAGQAPYGSGQGPQGPGPNGPRRPDGAPPIQRMAAGGAAAAGATAAGTAGMPPQRPTVRSDQQTGPEYWNYEEEETPRRNPAILVTVGGIAAALAVVAAVLLWPTSQATPTSGDVSSTETTSQEATPTEEPAVTEEPVPEAPVVTRQTQRPVPPVTRTTRPPPTTAPTTPTTAPTTPTTPTTTTTTVVAPPGP